MKKAVTLILRGCKLHYTVYFSAPSQSPGNIEWNLTNSKIFLHWQHVKAMDNESEVTGYKVRFVLSVVLLYAVEHQSMD